MAKAPYILAQTLKAAHEYAREVLNLGRGQYRVVTSPSSISAARGSELHMLPGWEKRHDRFAMKGALRYTRLEKIEVEDATAAPVQTPAPDPFAAPPAPAPDGLQPPGIQGTIDEFTDFVTGTTTEPAVEDVVADRTTLMQEVAETIPPEEGDPKPAPTPESEPAPETPAPKRRRSKCKQCSTLHYKDEACPESAE